MPTPPYPFRLGSTSYVYEAGLVENARRLCGQVDDMQLLLFCTPQGESNIPTPREIQQLVEVAGGTLRYSLHLPLFIQLMSESPTARERALDDAARLLDLCAPLNLSLVVAHLEGGEPPAWDEAGWTEWQTRAREMLARLQQLALAPICVENIEQYPIERALPLLAERGQPLCIDIGHHLKRGEPVEPIIHRRLAAARAIHLHGWDGQQDHVALSERSMPRPVISALLRQLHAQQWAGVLTLELFGEADFFASVRWLAAQWQALFI